MTYGTTPADDPSRFDARIRFWETAAYIVFPLFLWWPMAFAAFSGR